MPSEPLYDAPGVTFPPGHLRRLSRWVQGVRGRRERGGWSGSVRARVGAGEFEGYRPYRPGEDVRQLDWNLYARLGRPYVRVQRPEGGARWCILLDTGATMGLGRPGKLQFASELCLAIAAAGGAQGVSVELVTRSASDAPIGASFNQPADLGAWVGLLESLTAPVARPWSWEGLGPTREPCTRLFAIGDLLRARPERLQAWTRPGRRVDLVHVLAPHEFDPGRIDAEVATFVDRADGERRSSALTPAARARYASELARRLEGLRSFVRRQGVQLHVSSSEADFEDVVRPWIGA